MVSRHDYVHRRRYHHQHHHHHFGTVGPCHAAVNVNSAPPLVRGRREFDVESWGAKYFFTVDFLAYPLKLCDINSSNTWVLIVFIFVEFLLSYLFSARRIQNVRSAPQNARITSFSIHCRPLHDGGGK
jgi:hypothetical protein